MKFILFVLWIALAIGVSSLCAAIAHLVLWRIRKWWNDGAVVNLEKTPWSSLVILTISQFPIATLGESLGLRLGLGLGVISYCFTAAFFYVSYKVGLRLLLVSSLREGLEEYLPKSPAAEKKAGSPPQNH